MSDTTTQTTRLVLEAGDISKGLDKLEKDVFKIGVKTEETLAKLNSQSSLYKTLESNHSRLVEFQAKINKLKTDDTKSSSQINKELQYSLNKFSVMKQQVTDINKVLGTTPSQLKRQENELTRVQDKFASLNREVRQLEGHYKGFGSNKNLDALKGKLEDIKKQQQIINTLSSKGIVNLTTKDLRTLDTAKAKFRSLKNEVAEIKTDLSDVPISGLARSAGLRAIGYSALFATIAGTTQAIADGVQYVIEYDASVTKLSVILDVSRTKAENLQEEIVALTQAYGESLQVISDVALELGRSGIAYDEVANATKTVIKLTKLTGDSAEIASKSVVAWLQVFGKDKLGKATASVEELGGMIAFMANESKLSIDDINTLGTYALQTAKSLNLTTNVLSSVGAALNNNGVASSNLGVSFRRLEKIVNSNSTSMDSFFNSIGINRQKLLLDLAEGGRESDEAFNNLLKTFAGISDQDFLNMLSKVPDVLTKETLNQLRNNAIPIMELYQKSLNVTTEELDKADKIAESYQVTFQRLNNNWREIKGDVFQPLIGGLADFSQALLDNKDSIKSYLGDFAYFTSFISAGFIGRDFDNDVRKYSESLNNLFNVLDESTTKGFSESQVKAFRESTDDLLRELKKTIPYLSDEAKPLGEALVDGFEKGLEELNTSDFLNKTLKVKLEELKKQQKTLAEGLSFKGTNTEKAQSELIKLEKEIAKIEVTLGKFKKEAESGITTVTPFRLLDAESVLGLEQTLGKVSKFFDSSSIETTKAINSVFDSINNEINQGILEINKKYSLDLNKNNILDTSAKLLAEITNLNSELVGLSSDEKKEKTKVILGLQEQAGYIENILKLQGSLKQRENELLDKQKAQVKEVQKRYKQEDDITKTLVKQIIETNLLTKAGEERSSQIAEEIATRKENLILIKSSTEYEKEIAKIKSLEVDYAKALNKEETKRENILERVQNKVKDEELRIQELLGLKDKELQSENALRDLRASKDFQKLPQEQQDAQVKALENLIKQEKAYKGLNKSVIEYSKSIPDVNEALEKVGSVGLQSLENGFMDFFDVTSEGFMDMEKLGKDVLKSIYKELIKTMLVQPLVGGIGSIFGGTQQSSSGNTTGSIVGGIISGIFGGFNQGGYLPTKGFANGGLLTGGSGVRDDLYMGNVNGTQVFAMGGEFFTKKDSVNAETRPMLEYINKTGSVPNMGATGQPVVVNTPTTINIENNTGQPIEASMVEEMMRNDEGEEYEKVVNIMLRAKNEDSRIRSAFSNGNQ